MAGGTEDLLAVFMIILVTGAAGISMLIEDVQKCRKQKQAEEENVDQSLHGRDHERLDDHGE